MFLVNGQKRMDILLFVWKGTREIPVTAWNLLPEPILVFMNRNFVVFIGAKKTSGATLSIFLK